MSGPVDYLDFQRSLDPFFPAGVRRYWKALYLDGFSDAAIDTTVDWSNRRPSDDTLVIVRHCGGAMSRVGAEETAFGDRSSEWMLSIDSTWHDPADDAANVAYTRAFWDAAIPFSDGKTYFNFPGLLEEGDAAVRASYGANHARLAAHQGRLRPGQPLPAQPEHPARGSLEPGVSRDLRLLAGAVFLSAAGDLLALIVLALQVHELTGSGLAVSALFATTLVPVVALAPLAGLVADRFESVRVLVAASLVQALVAAALAFSGDLAAILALSSLLTAGNAFGQPAEFTLVPAVAGSRRVTEATGVLEAARYAGFAAGPVLAAGLAALGPRPALLVNAASFVAIAAAAGAMRARRPPCAGRHASSSARSTASASCAATGSCG